MHLFLALFLWQISFYSYAETNSQELLMLPKFCQIRLANKVNSQEFSSWAKRLGPESIHIHHYCYGLKDLNKYKTDPKTKRKNSILNSAKSNFNYVLSRVQNPNFILLPDLYYRLAIVSKERGEITVSIDYANKSIQAKKSYLNPYILLSDLYLTSGQKSEAKDILLQAKKYHPNSKKLKASLKKLQ